MKTLLPKLRFPVFQDEWKEKRLDEIAFFYKGTGISKADIDLQGEIPCIRYGELYTIYGEVINTVFSKTNLPASELFLSKKNDVIIPSSGETKIDIARASCVLLNDIALGGDLNILRTDENGVFLSYLINGPYKIEIAKKAQGDAVVHLYANQLKLIKVAFPTKPEQQKITDCLTSLDELITIQSQKVWALQAYKKGLMQNLFPAKGESLPRLRFPEFESAGEWAQKTLGELGDVFMCKRIFAEETNGSAGVPFFKIGTLGGKPDAFIRKDLFDEYKSKYNFPRKGEILITCSGTVGKCLAYDGSDAYYQDSNIVWIDNPTLEISNEFLHNILLNVDWGKLNSTTITRIYTSDLKNLPIIFPVDKKEQQRIAELLTSIEEQISVQSETVEILKSHKKGLMQGLFPSIDEV